MMPTSGEQARASRAHGTRHRDLWRSVHAAVGRARGRELMFLEYLLCAYYVHRNGVLYPWEPFSVELSSQGGGEQSSSWPC